MLELMALACLWNGSVIVLNQDGTGPTLDKLVPLLDQGGYHYHIWGGLFHFHLNLSNTFILSFGGAIDLIYRFIQGVSYIYNEHCHHFIANHLENQANCHF